MKNLIILKIGGSIITDKFSKVPKSNLKNMKRVAKEISSVFNSDNIHLILINGAGSFGHPPVYKTGINKGIKNRKQLEAFAEIQRLQNELNSIFTYYLIREKLPAIPYQPSVSAVMEFGKLIDMDISILRELLKINMIPVLYGVPAFDVGQKCSILSGDQLAPFLAKKFKAQKIIYSTNVDGVFSHDPNLDPGAELIPEINSKTFRIINKYLKGSTAIDVTGGMYGKISNLRGTNIKAQIINGLLPGNIIKALKGKKFGTTVKI